MNGFDKDHNLNDLIGAELLQICFGKNEVILNFFPYGISISIYYVDKFIEDNIFIFDSILSFRKKINIIGKTVEKFLIKTPLLAVLTMSDSSELILRDVHRQFESVTFQLGGNTIVV